MDEGGLEMRVRTKSIDKLRVKHEYHCVFEVRIRRDTSQHETATSDIGKYYNQAR